MSDEMHVKNKLPKICSKLIFKCLPLKSTTENTFMLYKCFVEDILIKGIKTNPMNYTTEVQPDKFLDIKTIYEHNKITTKIFRYGRKLQVHWSSKISKRYKRNTIASDLNRAAPIISYPISKVPIVQGKFQYTDYPDRFINSVIKSFNENADEGKR